MAWPIHRLRVGSPASTVSHGATVISPVAASTAASTWAGGAPSRVAAAYAAPVTPQCPCGCQSGPRRTARPNRAATS